MPRFADRAVLLFDLDGTLIDSAPDIAAAVNDVLAEDGLSPLTVPRVRSLVGDGAATLVARAFAECRSVEPADALARFRQRYEVRCLEKTSVYPGMRELLERAASSARRSVVVTNKPTAFSEKIVAGLGLGSLVAAVIGPERAPAKKPDPAHVRAALDVLGAPPSDAVMIGDGPTDMASGRRAGCATIAVLWGYRGRADLEPESPTAWAATPGELSALL